MSAILPVSATWWMYPSMSLSTLSISFNSCMPSLSRIGADRHLETIPSLIAAIASMYNGLSRSFLASWPRSDSSSVFMRLRLQQCSRLTHDFFFFFSQVASERRFTCAMRFQCVAILHKRKVFFRFPEGPDDLIGNLRVKLGSSAHL